MTCALARSWAGWCVSKGVKNSTVVNTICIMYYHPPPVGFVNFPSFYFCSIRFNISLYIFASFLHSPTCLTYLQVLSNSCASYFKITCLLICSVDNEITSTHFACLSIPKTLNRKRRASLHPVTINILHLSDVLKGLRRG